MDVIGVDFVSAAAPPTSPALFRAMSNPETATISPEIAPITLGVVLKSDARKPPESPSPDPPVGSMSVTAQQTVDSYANVLLGGEQAKLSHLESCEAYPALRPQQSGGVGCWSDVGCLHEFGSKQEHHQIDPQLASSRLYRDGHARSTGQSRSAGLVARREGHAHRVPRRCPPGGGGRAQRGGVSDSRRPALEARAQLRGERGTLEARVHGRVAVAVADCSSS